ncbi:MAG: ATP-binding cassette domain-containing protein [Promethearchaeota archaeon]
MENQKVIEIRNLKKVYKLKQGGTINALDDITLEITKGEIFGLLGPNGAGKTTLISILSTLLQPTSGTARLFGVDVQKNPKKVKRRLGLMLGDEMIYYRLTGRDNLNFFCRIYNIKDYKKKIKEITTTLGINHKLNEYVSNYSRGQKLRIALSRILLINPELLILDEPLLGMDPKTTREIIKILQNLNKTILLTSHQMHVVQQLCNRIAFLNHGKIIKVDSSENFMKVLSHFIRISFKIREQEKLDIINELNTQDYIKTISRKKDEITVSISDNKYYPAFLKFIGDFPVFQIKELEPTLDDIFIELSKK